MGEDGLAEGMATSTRANNIQTAISNKQERLTTSNKLERLTTISPLKIQEVEAAAIEAVVAT